MKSMRPSTLQTLGLGSVTDIFKNGRLPVREKDLVDKVFGPTGDRGCLLITGGNGIVGSGKAMQLGARLLDFGVPVVTLDLPDAPDGIGKQYSGLKRSFGPQKAAQIMGNVVRLSYDGTSLPSSLKHFKPRFVLEAIPEILPLKKAHYALLRQNYPGLEIRSVTSGFPSSELGVGILHPSFPHQINKMWEVIEDKPSDITKMLLALGMIPIPVGDYWSFVLDVLFCGITLAAIRYHSATNMPYWKIDKLVRKYVGPNPLRAHDAIGSGASFLTWSCVHHLAEKYGEVFRPDPELIRRKSSGEAWYSNNRPLVDWELWNEDEFKARIFGPLFQMTSLMLHEKRAHLSYLNSIGESCAQFSRGILALMRSWGEDAILGSVSAYHEVHPEAGKSCWYPEVFKQMSSHDWQQLYVNAEHEDGVGVVTIGREALNWDVIQELNRAVDWLKSEGIEKIILCGDFHLSAQLIGADTTEFFPALNDEKEGFRVASEWSKTARRFHQDFKVSVAFLNGKRCLGGMLELMMHCHYLVCTDEVLLGMPEVTLPVVPGMEGCHWQFRKAQPNDYPKLFDLLLTGKSVQAKNAVGWLVDYAGPLEEALKKVWMIAQSLDHGIRRRELNSGALQVSAAVSGAAAPADPARKAIYDCIIQSCGTTLAQSLDIQAKHSAGFMITSHCHKGEIGRNRKKVMEA